MTAWKSVLVSIGILIKIIFMSAFRIKTNNKKVLYAERGGGK